MRSRALALQFSWLSILERLTQIMRSGMPCQIRAAIVKPAAAMLNAVQLQNLMLISATSCPNFLLMSFARCQSC